MGATQPRTVADLGEFGLIAEMARGMHMNASVQLGPGDDAAIVALPDRRCVISTDILVEGVHFKGEWCSATDVGHRAAAASLADIAAMGATTVAIVVTLTGPSEMNAQWALDLARGVTEECDSTGAAVVGGDLSRARHVSVGVTAIGTLEGRDPVTRGGAKPGDVVAIAGRQGWAAAGLTVLTRGFRSPRLLVDAYRRPQPPYAAGPRAAGAGATAMLDVSDGLLADLGHIAGSSSVLIDIDPDLLPVADQLADAAAAFNVDPMIWFLTGGDDHPLVATFAPTAVLPEEFVQIGRVLSGEEPGVLVAGTPWVGSPAGHEHFT